MELPIIFASNAETEREEIAKYQPMSTDEKIREIERLRKNEIEELKRTGWYEETMRIRNEQKTKGLLEFFKRMKEIGYWIESDTLDADEPTVCIKS